MRSFKALADLWDVIKEKHLKLELLEVSFKVYRSMAYSEVLALNLTSMVERVVISSGD